MFMVALILKRRAKVAGVAVRLCAERVKNNKHVAGCRRELDGSCKAAALWADLQADGQGMNAHSPLAGNGRGLAWPFSAGFARPWMRQARVYFERVSASTAKGEDSALPCVFGSAARVNLFTSEQRAAFLKHYSAHSEAARTSGRHAVYLMGICHVAKGNLSRVGMCA